MSSLARVTALRAFRQRHSRFSLGLFSGVSKAVPPGTFDRRERLYPRVQNAVIHPTVAAFFALGRERIIKRCVGRGVECPRLIASLASAHTTPASH